MPVWNRITRCGRRVRARATRRFAPSQLRTLKSALALIRGNLEREESQ